MKSLTFSFTAIDRFGEQHEYTIDLCNAFSCGLYNRDTADRIVFGSITGSVEDVNDLDELTFIGRQSEEVRSFFYNLLWLGVTDRHYRFLLPDDPERIAIEENFMSDGILTHIELWHDHKGYHSLTTTIDPVAMQRTSYRDLSFSSFSRAFFNFFDYLETCADKVCLTLSAAHDILDRINSIESSRI